MLYLYFLRHGQTDYNLKGIVQGAGVDAPLNRTGIIQARQFFEAYRHIPFDGFYCSKQQRSYQTLLPWMEIGHKVVPLSGLQELSWGNLEGVKPNAEQRKIYQELVTSWANGHTERRVEGGESPEEVWSRLKWPLNDIFKKHKKGKVLICSHGRTIRVILSMFVGKGLSDMEPFKSANTGLNILEVSPEGEFKAIKINNTDHLVNYD